MSRLSGMILESGSTRGDIKSLKGDMVLKGGKNYHYEVRHKYISSKGVKNLYYEFKHKEIPLKGGKDLHYEFQHKDITLKGNKDLRYEV